ncbi:MAG: FAD-dependent oxidoreductase [Dehalococcoidales bacterium]|nr:FAD-dependent oxidoreductase [Dehalococcoidales bacterium]
MSSKYEKLLEPGFIGQVKTRNRIIKTGAGTFMWHEDETAMNNKVLAFYEALARGGVGLLIVESPTIDYPAGVRWRERYRIDDDRYIKGLSQLTEVIHRHGCPTFMQMNHDGPWQTDLGFNPDSPFGGPPIASSTTVLENPGDFHNETPHQLTVEEIEIIIDKFASAAERAQKAGFDGVDINSASTHLLHNFLSPFWNKRTDEYGGERENRTRFTSSIIREIKKRCGGNFPVSVCINGMEVGQAAGIENSVCITPEESKAIARLLQDAGADAVQVRNIWFGYHVGGYLPDVLFYPESPVPVGSMPKEYNASQHGAGANLKLAEIIRKNVTVPVITVGKVLPELGDQAIREHKADFIGMTRALQADPELPNKLLQGREKDIAPCTRCENCLGSQRCRINPFMGKEYNIINRAAEKKNVMVIGGGPAGMQAAMSAAQRGHSVTLYEKENNLGGLLPAAAVVKGTEMENIPDITEYLKRQLEILKVTVRTGKTADKSLVERERPDAVIVATGGISTLPDIPGIDNPKVVSTTDLMKTLKGSMKFFKPGTLRSLTKFYLPVGKTVIIIGSGLQGCELAEFFTRRGRKVTIVDTAPNPGTDMVDVLLAHLLKWFEKKGVTLINGVREYVGISDEGLAIIDKGGVERCIEAESIIPALPLRADHSLANSLKGIVPEVNVAGDCYKPGLIADAISKGMTAGRRI